MNKQKQSVHFISLGCPKNLVDSEVMLGKLKNGGYNMTENPGNAEIIIINTCSFINDAKVESIDTILEMIDYKSKDIGICKKLIVTGCLPQRYVKELKDEFNEVDLFIGVNDYHKVVSLIEGEESQKFSVSDELYLHSEKEERVVTSSAYSWLKISEGCNRACSFCTIPSIRGKLRSRSVESLINEAKDITKSGVKELILIAQDLSQYGKDFGKKDLLVELLNKLEEIKELKWIRLMYLYPDDLSEKLVEKIRTSNKICNYLDIPIQHFSNSVLTKMNRNIHSEEIFEKLFNLRNQIPDISLRTSLIVGFPGETEEDFEILLKGIAKVKFNNLGIFKYSDEEGTKASTLIDKLSDEVIESRYLRAYELQEKIANERNLGFIGKTIEVIVEGIYPESDKLIQARYRGQAPEIDGVVIINDVNGKDISIGDLESVKITDCYKYDLVGHLI